jgi:hypothetical protein
MWRRSVCNGTIAVGSGGAAVPRRSARAVGPARGQAGGTRSAGLGEAFNGRGGSDRTGRPLLTSMGVALIMSFPARVFGL